MQGKHAMFAGEQELQLGNSCRGTAGKVFGGSEVVRSSSKRSSLTRGQSLWILRGMAEIVKVKVVREDEGFQCQVCGHAWVPRYRNRLPRRCPELSCRSRRWDRTQHPTFTPPEGPNGGAPKVDALPVIGHPHFPRRPPVSVPPSLNPGGPHDALAA